MDMKLGVKALAHDRRAGHPWLGASNLHLSAGPHLFLDWRFVLPGELGLIGPYWAAEDGREIPLRVAHTDEWKDRPIDARYIPQDVPQGIRIVAQSAEKGDPFPRVAPQGRALSTMKAHIEHGTGQTRRRARRLRYAESSDGYEWRNERECAFDWEACPEAAGNERPEIFIDPTAPESERFKMFFRSGVGDTMSPKGG